MVFLLQFGFSWRPWERKCKVLTLHKSAVSSTHTHEDMLGDLPPRHKYMYRYAHTDTHTGTPTQVHTQTYTHGHTHTGTHTDTHTGTHRHTQVHTRGHMHNTPSVVSGLGTAEIPLVNDEGPLHASRWNSGILPCFLPLHFHLISPQIRKMSL